MAFGSFQGNQACTTHTLSEINMVPLIDVVLVLLVLFILAAPMASQSVKVTLPQTAATSTERPVKVLDLTIDANGQLFDQSGQPLQAQQVLERVQRHPAHTVRIWSDANVTYRHVAQLIALLQQAGVTQLALMTRPD